MITAPLSGGKYERPAIYWFLWGFIMTYVVLIFVWTCIGVNNTSFVHTWFREPGMPGAELISHRNSFTSISLRLTIVVQLLTPFVIMLMIAYRSKAMWSVVCVGILLLGFIISTFSWAALSDAYSHCNKQDQYGNICNDPKLCCIPEIRANPGNHCPNTVDCATPLMFDDVSPRDDFLLLYWIHFTLWLLMAFFFIIMLVIWYSPAEQLPTTVEPEASEKQDIEEPEETVSAASKVTDALVSGLAPMSGVVARRRKVKRSGVLK